MTPLFTFDDGPSEWTAPILDLLAEHEEHAIFFAIGEHAEARPDDVRRAHEEGHVVGVHTWSHPRLTDASLDVAAWELKRTADLLAGLLEERPGIWRAPFFATSEVVNSLASRLGLAYLGANLIPDDWRAEDAEELAARVLAAVRPQSVICLHDGIPPDGGSEACTDSRQATVDALRLILEGLKA